MRRRTIRIFHTHTVVILFIDSKVRVTTYKRARRKTKDANRISRQLFINRIRIFIIIIMCVPPVVLRAILLY